MTHVERDLIDVVETLRHVRGRPARCSLLIGAGCSVTAGIPAAGGIVEYVEHNYGRKFARATQPTYPDVMAELHERERRDVIGHFVDSDDLRVNWAHLCIGLLVHEGFVDRVLTTNFDPLVVRACAMLDDFPPVYDFGTSQLFQPANTPDKAVFYLHGQRSGFRMLHTVAECADHAKRLAPLIHETVQGRTVIVVGYSGANDPVFDLLAETDQFDNGLYWVAYEDEPPAPHVRDRLLCPRKDAFLIRGHDADSFFLRVAQELGVFPPEAICRPFSHLDECMGKLADLPLEAAGLSEDPTAGPREWVRMAAIRFEPEPVGLDECRRFMLGGPPGQATVSPLVQYAWQAEKRARRIAEQAAADTALAERAQEAEAVRLLSGADAQLEDSQRLYPNCPDSLALWAHTLILWARLDKRPRSALLARARAKLLVLEDREPGRGACMLACAAAMEGNSSDCRRWLEVALQGEYPPKQPWLRNDPDLRSVRNAEWFKALADRAPQ